MESLQNFNEKKILKNLTHQNKGVGLPKELLKQEQKIVEKAKNTITKISEQFKNNEKKIGQELLKAHIKQREQERKENKLAFTCPKCKKGKLIIIYSKKNKRFFVACDTYPDCNNTYTLPPKTLIKKTDKTCEHCGFPELVSIKSGKKPWEFCFNPNCKTNKKRLEEYRKKQTITNKEK